MNLRSSLTFVGTLAAASTLGLVGCTSGPESYAYVSDVHSPKTITLLDTSNGNNIQVWDVPVGQQLNLRFNRDPLDAERQGSDVLKYSLRPAGDESLSPGGTISTPPPSSRRFEVSLRKSPEMRVPDVTRRTSSVPTEGR